MLRDVDGEVWGQFVQPFPGNYDRCVRGFLFVVGGRETDQSMRCFRLERVECRAMLAVKRALVRHCCVSCWAVGIRLLGKVVLGITLDRRSPGSGAAWWRGICSAFSRQGHSGF